MENIELLDKIIVGRVEPHIYAFTTNTIPNYLKVGDTYRPVSVRLKEWKEIYPDLKKEYEKKAMVDENTFFRDYAVHHYLENDLNKNRINPNDFSDVYVSNEFFKETTVIDVEAAIDDIQKSFEENLMKYQYYNADSRLRTIEKYTSTGYWDLRPNQQAVVDKFKYAIEHGRNNLLMYAVMRFGKSFTSMCCALEMKAKIVVIVSAKADVKEEWKKTIESAENFNEYDFITSEDLLDENIISKKLKEKRKLAIFLTLQDLQGNEIKEKHKEIFNSKIDLLLIDETHFGARADKYGAVLRDGFKDVNDTREDGFVDFEDALNQIKTLNSKVRIHLSGTPYRILMGSEFTKDDIIAFCQFSDIVNEQEKWNKEHFEDIENSIINDKTGKPYEEWDNPYYGFPQMVRFAFNPNESVRKRLEELRKNGISYAFSELFRPKSIKKNSNGDHKKFIYENEVLDLLEVIDGTKSDENVLGFLDYDKIKSGKMCRHMVMVLPYRASCDAIEELIKNNDDKFKNLNQYEIINISGVDNPNLYKNVNDIKNKIKEYENENKKTLTLTVNRMLTGSTVEEWDTMIYLKDTSSPQEYDQAIFRLQNQYIKNYLSKDGNLIKYNKKPQTLLVDFDPNRMFIMQETKSMIYNANVDKAGNSKLEERISNELKISPIIVLNKNKIKEIQAVDIMNAISNYSKNRGVFEEVNEIPVDLSLINIPDILEVISKQGKFGTRQGFKVVNTEDDSEQENFDFGDIDENVLSNSDNTVSNKTLTHTQEDDKNNLTKQFRTYYARILFFAVLTKNSVSSLEDIINSINDENNERIAHHLGLDKNILILLNKKIDIFVLRQLDYKIQNINNLSNDDSLSELDRAKIAINKFDKLSDSEIITPQKICHDMLEEVGTHNLIQTINNNNKILDIASKGAEFTLALVDILNENNIDYSKYKNNIYSIPTSGIAYEFTRKIYEILGLNINNISENLTSYDLLSIRNSSNNIDYNLIQKLLLQNKKFSNIDKSDIESKMKGDESMRFDVIIGNPPYQENTNIIGNQGKPIYNHFVEIFKNMNPKNLSFIIPSRWFAGGMGLDSFRKNMLNDHCIKTLVDFNNAKDCFPSNSISGGVCYFLRDSSYSGECKVVNINNDKISEMYRSLSENDVFIRYNEAIPIIRKVKSKNFKCMNELVSSISPFGISTKIHGSVEKNKKRNIKLHSSKGVGYISIDDVKNNHNMLKKYKVILSQTSAEHANEPSIEGKYKVLTSTMKVIGTDEVCTHSYLIINPTDDKIISENTLKYLKTKFVRFLLLQTMTSIHITSSTFSFVPIQKFEKNSDINWDNCVEDIDKQLFKKYKLSNEEIDYINEKIKNI